MEKVVSITRAGCTAAPGAHRSSASASPSPSEKPPLQRKLTSRHISFFAIGATIGSGLFLGSGTALARAGPAGCLLAFAVVASILYPVMASLAEMATFVPTAGSFTSYASRFVHPSLGFAAGWLYYFSWALTYPFQLTAAGLILRFWLPHMSIAYPIAGFGLVISALNFLPVKTVGEISFVFTTIKVLTIGGYIVFGICIAAGAGRQGVLGFRNFSSPFDEYLVDGRPGVLVAFVAVLIQAAFSYQGTELVGVSAKEALTPHRTVPSAVKWSFWGVFALYLFTVFFNGLLVPSDDPDLLADASDATASPMVIAAKLAGVPQMAHYLNSVFLTAVLTSAHSSLYGSSRMMLSLADEGHALAVLGRTRENGVPWVAVLVTSAFWPLAFMNLSAGGATVFNWFLNVIGVAGVITWAVISMVHIRFMRALEAQDIERAGLPYVAFGQPYMAWYGLIGNVLVALVQGFTVFIAWDTLDFLGAYLSLVLFVVLLVGHMCITGSKIVPLREANLAPEDVDKKGEKGSA